MTEAQKQLAVASCLARHFTNDIGTRNMPAYQRQPGLVECVRVYENLSMKVEPRLPEHVAEWRAYNELWRFGNALFVQGECVYAGCLTDEEVATAKATIAQRRTTT